MFVFSSLPGADFSSQPKQDFAFRKALHIFEYLVLCLCLYRASKKPFTAVVLTIAFAISDELHQTFVPTRTGRVLDVAIDSASAVVMGVVLWRYFQNLPNKLKNWLSE